MPDRLKRPGNIATNRAHARPLGFCIEENFGAVYLSARDRSHDGAARQAGLHHEMHMASRLARGLSP